MKPDNLFQKKQNKYHNVKTIYGGIRFDSKKEAGRYAELKMLENAGKIKNLKLQQKFLIVPKTKVRARYYIADFTYEINGDKYIEDVKSPITRKNPVYSLKKALVLWQYPDFIFLES